MSPPASLPPKSAGRPSSPASIASISPSRSRSSSASAGVAASAAAASCGRVAGGLTYQAKTERCHRPQALDPRYSDVIGFIDGQVPLWLYFDPEGVREHSSAQAHRIAHLPLVIARQMQPRTFSQLLDEKVFPASPRDGPELRRKPHNSRVVCRDWWHKESGAG